MTRRSSARHDQEAGSATLWVLALALLLAAVAAAALTSAEIRVLRAAAASTADLAALAAAAALPDVGSGCAQAARVAAAVGAGLASCTTDGSVVDVVVVRPLPAPWAWLGPVTARSRAGPPAAR